jgi:glutamine synthetase
MSNCILEYVWLDSINNFRSKIKVIPDLSKYDISQEWNYDGSSTGQAYTDSSEVIIKPCVFFSNPLIEDSILIICDTYDKNGNHLSNNHRWNANKIFDKNKDEEPWFGLEQEYFMFNYNESLQAFVPLGFSLGITQGEFYCSPIKQDNLATMISEEHLIACIKAGIKISGINAEVAPGQFEFQIGPSIGIEAGDHLLAARYLLERIASKYDVSISYDPKPSPEYNGSGCHINFSTQSTRTEGGLNTIEEYIQKLNLKHMEHMKVYGENNDKRMTGLHETSSYNNFTYGVGTRNTSIRIGHETFKNKCGYFEDRRPASNIDPYLATSKIFETCCT